MRGVLLTFFAVLLIVGALPLITDLQLENEVSKTGSLEDIDNETVNVTTAGINTLNESNRERVAYNTSIDFYNASDVELNETGNYTWISANGTFTVQDNAYIDNNTDVNISYGYRHPSETQNMSANIAVYLSRSGESVILLAAALVLIAAMLLVAGRS